LELSGADRRRAAPRLAGDIAMKTTYRIVATLAVVAVIAFAAWLIYGSHRERAAGILTERIVHSGDQWTANFTARIPAPERAVYQAIENPQDSHSDQVSDVKVLEQSADSKTVEMTIDGPGGQPIVMRLRFKFDQLGERISYDTLDNPMQQTHGEYRLAGEGESTLISYHQTTKMLQEIPLPDGVIKEGIRAIFVAQLEGLEHALHVSTAGQSEEDEN
jgi:hypothetical protein